MAIKIKLSETESRLFCCSKWWGDPDMPADMQYPMYIGEDGEEYPLTFICQIDCADIAETAPDTILPKEGMLYFFAALDEYLGYEVPFHLGLGDWPKGTVKVKYTKSVNPETFESFIMVDENDEPLTAAALKMEFSVCDDEEDGLKLLGVPFNGDVRDSHPEEMNFLQVDSEDETLDGVHIYDCGMFNILLSKDNIENARWSRSLGCLSSL